MARCGWVTPCAPALRADGAQLQPVQAATCIAGHQELVVGDPGQSADGGIGHEEHPGGAIGAARIPQADGGIARARSEESIAQHHQGPHPILMPLEDGAAGATGRIP